MTQRKER